MNTITESVAGVAAGETSAHNGAVNGLTTGPAGTLKGVKAKPVQPKDHASKRRAKWLRRLTKEFLRLEGLFPWKDFLPKENCPEWVGRVELEYASALHPAWDVKNATGLTPRWVGTFLGYQCAFAVWMVENIDSLNEQESKHPEMVKNLVLTEEQYEQGAKALVRWNEWYAALRRLAGRALKSCVYQPYEDMTAFLNGYSSAFAKKPRLGASLGDFGNTAFGIYHFMLWHWRVVERLQSVRALHEWLRQSMGEYRVGDLKRVEKICSRIGLRFRKPGRPKATD